MGFTSSIREVASCQTLLWMGFTSSIREVASCQTLLWMGFTSSVREVASCQTLLWMGFMSSIREAASFERVFAVKGCLSPCPHPPSLQTQVPLSVHEAVSSSPVAGSAGSDAPHLPAPCTFRTAAT